MTMDCALSTDHLKTFVKNHLNKTRGHAVYNEDEGFFGYVEDDIELFYCWDSRVDMLDALRNDGIDREYCNPKED